MLLSQRIKKRYYKTLGTRVINHPLSPLSLLQNVSSFIFSDLKGYDNGDRLILIPKVNKQRYSLLLLESLVEKFDTAC